jgi:hypothetical protein
MILIWALFVSDDVCKLKSYDYRLLKSQKLRNITNQYYSQSGYSFGEDEAQDSYYGFNRYRVDKSQYVTVCTLYFVNDDYNDDYNCPSPRSCTTEVVHCGSQLRLHRSDQSPALITTLLICASARQLGQNKGCSYSHPILPRTPRSAA